MSDLKSLLREQEVVPLRIIWQGAKHRAFLLYANGMGAEHALTTLKKLSIYGHTLHAECVRSHTKQDTKLAGKGPREGSVFNPAF